MQHQKKRAYEDLYQTHKPLNIWLFINQGTISNVLFGKIGQPLNPSLLIQDQSRFKTGMNTFNQTKRREKKETAF